MLYSKVFIEQKYVICQTTTHRLQHEILAYAKGKNHLLTY